MIYINKMKRLCLINLLELRVVVGESGLHFFTWRKESLGAMFKLSENLKTELDKFKPIAPLASAVLPVSRGEIEILDEDLSLLLILNILFFRLRV